MTMDLPAGGNTVIAPASGARPVFIGIDWQPRSLSGYEVEALLLPLKAEALVTSAEAILTPARAQTLNGAIAWSPTNPGGPMGEAARVARVDLAALPASVVRLLVCLVLRQGAERGQRFSLFGRLAVTLAESDPEGRAGAAVTCFAPDPAGHDEAALILTEIYRHREQWKMRALGQGFRSGLPALADTYGFPETILVLGADSASGTAPSSAPGAAVPPTPTPPTPAPPSTPPPPPHPTHDTGSGHPAGADPSVSPPPAGGPDTRGPARPGSGPDFDQISSKIKESGTMALNWLKEQKDKLQAEVGKFKNRTFMEGVVAGCALVAAADGSIDSSEKQKMLGFMQQSDALKVFKAEDIIDAFNKITGKFEFDHAIGKAEALAMVAKVKKDSEQARLLVRVCCAIGAADGDFDADERKIVQDICHELGLNPSEFDL